MTTNQDNTTEVMDEKLFAHICEMELDAKTHNPLLIVLLRAIQKMSKNQQRDRVLDILYSKGGDPGSMDQDAGLVLATMILEGWGMKDETNDE